MRYEDLCRGPETELRRICAFLGLPFDPRMLRPADRDHHFVHSSRSGYLRGTNEVRLDERWREELPGADRARVEAVMRRLEFQRPYLDAPAGG